MPPTQAVYTCQMVVVMVEVVVVEVVEVVVLVVVVVVKLRGMRQPPRQLSEETRPPLTAPSALQAPPK